MLNIQSWYGRAGNNILQIIRAIHYAMINGHNSICFQYHSLLTSNIITLENIENINKSQINDTFFSFKKYNIIDPEPYIMKEYFQKYIKPIFKIQMGNDIVIANDTDIYIHFRGGDIFSSNPHKAYVQPPLSYYKNITNDYNSIKLVCEDKKNPCINELLKQENVEYISNTLEKDLSILSNVSNLVVGFGTSGFLLYLMNPHLKNLYIPDFFINELPKGAWGDDISVHIIELPNYIKVGDWKNTAEQQKILLEY
jgi:hypothetical protein